MKQIKEIISKFSNNHILVIGDVILDEYVFGNISRISPEAPVPILNITGKEFRLGGAANVANNIHNLGGKSTIIGRVGKDSQKEEIIKMLDERGIKHFLIEGNDYSTIMKTRIIAHEQQTMRLDLEKTHPISEKEADNIIDFVKKQKPDLIIISDYNKGLITQYLMDQIKKTDNKILVDPKPKNISLYKGVFAITPNEKEAREIFNNADNESFENIENIGNELISRLDANIIITRGADGVSLFDKKTGVHQYLPTKAREVFDVSGAGDTFIASLALAIASKASLYESAIIANYAAGVSVGKKGTAVVRPSELNRIISEQDNKIKDLGEMIEIVKELHSQGKKVVFTNGCFDILHAGHVRLLREARKLGNTLILGLNTDESIRKLKGPDRPINNQDDRAEVLANLKNVDYIVFFGEATPCNIISQLKPDVHAKGGDYNPDDHKQMPEAKIVHDYGGRVEIIKFIEGKSTTSTINKIRETGEKR